MSGNKHMSGKSRRRQEKKALREMRSFDSWSEVNSLADNIREGLVMHYGIAAALRAPGIMQNLPDANLVADNLRLLKKDLEKLAAELDATSARHVNYSGYCKPEDVQLLLDILGRYDSLASEYQANVVPVASVIYEQIMAAETALQKKQEEAAANAQAPEVAVAEPVTE